MKYNKDQMRDHILEALALIDKTPGMPEEVKTDMYRMISQFAHLMLANVYAGFVDSIVELQAVISRQLTENMDRAQEKMAETRRSKLKVVDSDDDEDDSGETIH